jgi:hypothetical protein
MTQTLHAIPAATITHTTAVIYGDIISDITVHHARTPDARIGLTFGTTLMNLYSASAAQGLLEAFATARAAMARVPREIPAATTPPYEPFARTTLAIEWTRRPTYCVVPQSGPNKTGTAISHWVDVYCGPITFQIRDQLGLKSTLALLSRAHKTAIAVFLDGAEHAEDPTAGHYPGPG